MKSSLRISLGLAVAASLTIGTSLATAGQKQRSNRGNFKRAAVRQSSQRQHRSRNFSGNGRVSSNRFRGTTRNLSVRKQTPPTQGNFQKRSFTQRTAAQGKLAQGKFTGRERLKGNQFTQRTKIASGKLSQEKATFRDRLRRAEERGKRLDLNQNHGLRDAHRHLHGRKFREVFKHRATIEGKAGYRRALAHGHAHHWHHRPHCGWWSDFAVNCYYHNHGRFCPDTYWNHCNQYRYLYIACPGTADYAPSYWYFGCDVVYIPELGYGIESVTPNSPAALAGLRQGDMIVQVNGQTPAEDGALASAIQTNGGSLGLSVLRDGQQDTEDMQVALRRIQKSGF